MIIESNHPIHPHYGPCDDLGPDGVCQECLKIVAFLKNENEKLKEISERLSYYTEVAVERKSEIRKLKERIATLAKKVN